MKARKPATARVWSRRPNDEVYERQCLLAEHGCISCVHCERTFRRLSSGFSVPKHPCSDLVTDMEWRVKNHGKVMETHTRADGSTLLIYVLR